ncbi:MAG: DNA-processing protein DprA [Oscillospiraceae bacterium]
MDDNLLYWIWLTVVFGPANPRKWAVLSHFGDVKECHAALSRGQSPLLTEQERRSLKAAELEKCEKLLAYCTKKHITIYCFDSPDYPEPLQEIYNPPAVLFAYGALSAQQDLLSVGAVGARNPSDYSLRVCEALCGALAQNGVTVVSGFAAGVDTCAHRAAIAAGGRTIAVLGAGLEYDYPKGTTDFKREIAQNGAVISEYFPGHKPAYTDFKARNRILSGISRGVAVIEASTTSGSLNTVSHALSQSRDVFCVPPHDVFDRRYAGMGDLLRDGAIPLMSAEDILFEYGDRFRTLEGFPARPEDRRVKSEEMRALFSDLAVRDEFPENKRTRADEASAPAQPAAVLPDDATPLARAVWDCLKERPMHTDELAAALDADITDIFTELTELELTGAVQSLAGNRYAAL